MAFQNEISVLGATRYAVGLSQVIRIASQAYETAVSFNLLSGSSLEVVQAQLSGSSTASGATAWGTGYLVGTGEVVSVGGPACFYLAATGATAIVQVMYGYGAGATVL